MLLPVHERQRRLHIIEEGVKTEFWKVLRDSLEYYAHEKEKEALELQRDGGAGKDRASLVANMEAQAARRIMSEPATIIQANKGLFEKFTFGLCGKCGQMVKTLKEKILK